MDAGFLEESQEVIPVVPMSSTLRKMGQIDVTFLDRPFFGKGHAKGLTRHSKDCEA